SPAPRCFTIRTRTARRATPMSASSAPPSGPCGCAPPKTRSTPVRSTNKPSRQQPPPRPAPPIRRTIFTRAALTGASSSAPWSNARSQAPPHTTEIVRHLPRFSQAPERPWRRSGLAVLPGGTQLELCGVARERQAMDQILVKEPPREAASKRPRLPGQVVLVFQGGGALGAYQGGVYQALHEAGIEPDWVVGTSIGALNGAIIAGNEIASRLERLREFW